MCRGRPYSDGASLPCTEKATAIPPEPRQSKGATATEVSARVSEIPGWICSTAVFGCLPSRDARPHHVFVVTMVRSVLQALALGHITDSSFLILSRIHGGIRLCSGTLKTPSCSPLQRLSWTRWAFGSLEAAKWNLGAAWTGMVVTLQLRAVSPFQ